MKQNGSLATANKEQSKPSSSEKHYIGRKVVQMEYYDEVIEVKKKAKQEEKAEIKNQPTVDDDADRTTTIRPASSLPRKSGRKVELERRASSESDSSDSEINDNGNVPAEGFNYKQWENLNVPSEIKDLFQYIGRYSAPKIDISYTLQPFIPDFIPAVGDIDAFLKVVPPKPFSEKSKVIEFIDRLGFEILDEPCGNQSETALLHMKLRSVSTSNTRKPMPPPSISKSSKDIEKWITEVQALHANQPYPMVVHNMPAPDIDALMTEWPTKMEHVLNSVGFPSAQLDCSLKFYIELMCGLFDIPLPPTNNNHVDYLFALSTLFNLYLAVKNPIE